MANEGVLRILQSSSIAGTSPSDCLVSYPGHSLGGWSYPSAEKQSVYSTAQPTGQSSYEYNNVHVYLVAVNLYIQICVSLGNIYSREHKDQNDVKKKSKCEITFYFKAS